MKRLPFCCYHASGTFLYYAHVYFLIFCSLRKWEYFRFCNKSQTKCNPFEFITCTRTWGICHSVSSIQSYMLFDGTDHEVSRGTVWFSKWQRNNREHETVIVRILAPNQESNNFAKEFSSTSAPMKHNCSSFYAKHMIPQPTCHGGNSSYKN